MTSLSTHVLDTMHGRPASGMNVALSGPDGEISRATTNADGRCPDLAQGGLAPPPRLPAVAHVRAASGRGQILDAAVMLVIGDDAATAILHGEQVDRRARIDRRPIL